MYSLRWYQREAVDSIWSYLCNQTGNPVAVLPTGAGKSLVIAELCREAVERFKGRVICLAHRKELLTQNAEKIRSLLPGMDVGIYSAGLKSRDTDHDVVLAGIQSVYSRAFEFGERNLVIIDEVHLVPTGGEGMFRRFLDDLRFANPKLRMAGLTATPYRTGVGDICRADALFHSVCYSAPIGRLIDDGFLCPVTTTSAASAVDTSKLAIRQGEFVARDMEGLFDDSRRVEQACAEIVDKTQDRKSVLVFCCGVEHAGHVAQTIERKTGDECGIVTGETLELERESTLRRFGERELRYLVNVDVLTTGYDAPCIDAIAILRATTSAGLFAQMCGRGFRLFDGKADCLVLDFGENIERHGPIDAEDFGKVRRSPGAGSGGGDAPMKSCPNCETEIAVSVRECECGFLFLPAPVTHQEHAANGPILQATAKPTYWMVEEVVSVPHSKKGASDDDPRTLRVDYHCVPAEAADGNLSRKVISEWVCVEHAGFAGGKALKWWEARSITPMPRCADAAVDLFMRGAVARPRRIATLPDGKYTKIVMQELDEIPEHWDEEWDDDEEIPF